MRGIVCQLEQLGQRFYALRFGRVQRGAEVGTITPGFAIPRVHGAGSPLRFFIRVALGAGIRTAQQGRQIRARHAHAVVLPRMDHHVVLRRHVAGDALRALAFGNVLVVFRHVELGGIVATRTQRIAFGAKFQ